MRKPVIGVFKSEQHERIRRKLVRMKHGEMLDITAPEWVQVEIDYEGKVLWVHVDGITLFRACRIQHPVEIVDNRPAKRSKKPPYDQHKNPRG